ncbi:MAG TPA: immunoglobulin domain-containing protein [Verrucomicrobiae bacterium]|nr:immunoglobulin domain-containing protein [Verrucomicrobiae bacterium]
MKPKATKYLSVALAGILQILPVVRSALPGLQAIASSPTGALILRWVAGGVAYFGYHAISGATTLNYAISISPPTATQGKFYSGTLTWTGGYSGEVSSMSINGNCIVGTPYTISPGLSIIYSGGSTATISGTPMTSNLFTLTSEIYLYGNCTASSIYEATRTSPAFTVISSNGLPVGPIFNNYPQNEVAILGSPVNLFGSATGIPSPAYQWSRNLAPISGATNAALAITDAEITNAGTYSLMASNSTSHPSAICVLSVCLPPGTNFTTLYWTNYAVAGVPLTMTSFITNVSTATNSTKWSFNLGPPILTNQNFALTAGQVTPNKSGTYSAFFNSVNGTNVYANGIEFDSQWMFGYLPVITNQPTPVTVRAGSNATFTCTVAGGNFANIFLYQNGTNLVAQTNFLDYNPGGYGTNGNLQPGNASTTTNISLTVSNVTLANAGNYTFVITNFWGSTTSSPVALTVNAPPTVSSPLGQTNYAGKTVNVGVTSTGTAPLNFQWQKGGANVSNGGNISGALTNILTFSPAALANSGNYQVIVTNTSGSVTSTVAVVSIVPVPPFALSLGAGNAALSASGGVAGSNYIVQMCTNLASNSWTNLYTNSVPANGNISFTDANAPTNGQRYYRVQFP